MKILITGGAGFIGTNLIYYLQREKPKLEIVCLDALTYCGNVENLKRAMGVSKFKFVRGDISDKTSVEHLFGEEDFDGVINLAAESHVDRSIEEPGIFLRSNVLGTQVLMDACRKFDVHRFHQVSTDEVYGDLPLERPDLLFDESSPLKPSSPYSASKASSDLLALAYHRTYGLKVTITRCSNNYGPWQFPEKLVPRMIMLARMDEQLPIYGSGQNIRDWLHVDDHCSAIELTFSNGRPGEIYNVGGNNERRNIDVVRTILREMKKPESKMVHVADRLGHDLRYAIDARKITGELGWKPVHNFDEGIKGTIDWYLNNFDWMDRIMSKRYLESNERHY